MNSIVNTPKIAHVILAAGESKRMGSPKQLLPWKDSTLLGHAISEALKTSPKDVFVVLGANQKHITSELNLTKVQIISNPNWKTGMAGSIASAITFFKQKKLEYDALLLCLCDQPLLCSTHFDRLIKSFDLNTGICATSYVDGFGVPAIFGNSFFSDLQNLKGKGGAKNVMIRHKNALTTVTTKEKTIDLDTKETYDLYYEKFGK